MTNPPPPFTLFYYIPPHRAPLVDPLIDLSRGSFIIYLTPTPLSTRLPPHPHSLGYGQHARAIVTTFKSAILESIGKKGGLVSGHKANPAITTNPSFLATGLAGVGDGNNSIGGGSGISSSGTSSGGNGGSGGGNNSNLSVPLPSGPSHPMLP